MANVSIGLAPASSTACTVPANRCQSLKGSGTGLSNTKTADDLGAHQPMPPADLLAVLAQAKMPPAVDLVEAVAQLHAPCRGAARERLLVRRSLCCARSKWLTPR